MSESARKVFVARHQVRGYELDSYGHVNNSIYLNYVEHARWTMIEEAAGSMSYFKDNGCAPVVARVEIDYKRPCYLGEHLRIETTLLEYRKKVVVFLHKIIKEADGTLATEVRATLVAVDTTTGKTRTMPEDFEQRFGL